MKNWEVFGCNGQLIFQNMALFSVCLEGGGWPRNKILQLKTKAENLIRCNENTIIIGAKSVLIIWVPLVELEEIYDFDARCSNSSLSLHEINMH